MLCTANKTIHKMKRQATEWENILINDTSDQSLISKMYKELIKLKMKPNPIKKWAKT